MSFINLIIKLAIADIEKQFEDFNTQQNPKQKKYAYYEIDNTFTSVRSEYHIETYSICLIDDYLNSRAEGYDELEQALREDIQMNHDMIRKEIEDAVLSKWNKIQEEYTPEEE